MGWGVRMIGGEGGLGVTCLSIAAKDVEAWATERWPWGARTEDTRRPTTRHELRRRARAVATFMSFLKGIDEELCFR